MNNINPASPFDSTLPGNNSLAAVEKLSGSRTLVAPRSMKLSVLKSFSLGPFLSPPNHTLGVNMYLRASDFDPLFIPPLLPAEFQLNPFERYTLITVADGLTGRDYLDFMSAQFIGQENVLRERLNLRPVQFRFEATYEDDSEVALVLSMVFAFEEALDFYQSNPQVNFFSRVDAVAAVGLQLGLAGASFADNPVFSGFAIRKPALNTQVSNIFDSTAVIDNTGVSNWFEDELTEKGWSKDHPYWAYRNVNITRTGVDLATKVVKTQFIEYQFDSYARVAFGTRRSFGLPWATYNEDEEKFEDVIDEGYLVILLGLNVPFLSNGISNAGGFLWVRGAKVFFQKMRFVFPRWNGYGESTIEWEYDNYLISEVTLVVTLSNGKHYHLGMATGTFLVSCPLPDPNLETPYGAYAPVTSFQGNTISWFSLIVNEKIPNV